MSERDQDQGGGQQPPIGQNDDQPPKSEQDRQSEQGQQGQGAQPFGQQDTLGAGQSGGFGNQTSGTPQSESQSSAFGQQGQSATGQASEGGTDTLSSERDPSAGQGDLGDASDLGGAETGLGGQNPEQREGFVGSQGSGGSDDYLREGGSSPDATGGSDFARDGQGKTDNPDDPEQTRSQNRDSDIEGSSNT